MPRMHAAPWVDLQCHGVHAAPYVDPQCCLNLLPPALSPLPVVLEVHRGDEGQGGDAQALRQYTRYAAGGDALMVGFARRGHEDR